MVPLFGDGWAGIPSSLVGLGCGLPVLLGHTRVLRCAEMSRNGCVTHAFTLLPVPPLPLTGTEVAAGSLGPALDLCNRDLQHHR